MSRSHFQKIGLSSLTLMFFASLTVIVYGLNSGEFKTKSVSIEKIEKFLEEKYTTHYKLVKLLSSDEKIKNGSNVDKVGFLNNIASSFSEISYAFTVDNLGNLRAVSNLDDTVKIDRSFVKQIQGESWFQRLLSKKFRNYLDNGLVGASISKFTVDLLSKKSGHYFSSPYYDIDGRVIGHLIYFIDVGQIDKELDIFGVKLNKSFVSLDADILVSNNITDELGIYYSFKSSTGKDIIKNPIFYASIITAFSLFLFALILFKGFAEDELIGEDSNEALRFQVMLKESNIKISGLEAELKTIKNNTKQQKLAKRNPTELIELKKQIETKEKIFKIVKNKTISQKNEIEMSLKNISNRDKELELILENIVKYNQVVVQDSNKIKSEISTIYEYFVKLVKLKKNINVELMNAKLKIQRNELDPKVKDLLDIFDVKIEELSLLGVQSYTTLKRLNENCNNEKLIDVNSIVDSTKSLLHVVDMSKVQRDRALRKINELTLSIENFEKIRLELKEESSEKLKIVNTSQYEAA